MAGESATALQADRNKPELGSPITRLDMHMDRLCPITRVEEEPIWARFEGSSASVVIAAR